MRILLTASLAILCLLLIKCSAANESSADFFVPALLQRPPSIQHGKEWENVQNIYAKARQSVAKKPDDHNAYLRLCEVFVTEARITGEHGHYYPAALKVSNEVLDHHPAIDDIRFRALSLKAGVLLSQHEFSQALTVAKEAAKINPYNASIYGALVDANVELGNYQEAVKMADKMVSIRPDLRSYSRVSYLREIHGQVEGAIESMKMAVAAGFPGYEETCWARLTLGNLYKTYGQLDLAEQQYRMALSERENYPFAIAALAEVAIEKKEYQEAEKLLKDAVTIIPEVGFYLQLAELYQATERDAEYQKMLPIIDEMLADDVAHGHNMNLEYARLNLELTQNYDLARSYAQTEYERRPDNIDVNKLLAAVYLAQGDISAATKHLQVAKSTGSQNPEIVAMDSHLAVK